MPRVNPGWHEHLYDPGLLTQTCAQPPLLERHSLISAKQRFKILIDYVIRHVSLLVHVKRSTARRVTTTWLDSFTSAWSPVLVQHVALAARTLDPTLDDVTVVITWPTSSITVVTVLVARICRHNSGWLIWYGHIMTSCAAWTKLMDLLAECLKNHLTCSSVWMDTIKQYLVL